MNWPDFSVVGMSVCLPVCLRSILGVCLLFCVSVCCSECLSIILGVSLSVCLLFRVSVYLSVCMSVCMPDSLAARLSVCQPLFLSVCLSLYSSKISENITQQTPQPSNNLQSFFFHPKTSFKNCPNFHIKNPSRLTQASSDTNIKKREI